MNAPAIEQALLRAAVERIPADPLSAVRQDALSRFTADGFPTARHEDWRYTNLAPVIERSNTWLRDTAASEPTPAAATTAPDIDAFWITLANGHVGELPPELAELGVSVSRLAQAGAGQALDTGAPMSSFNAALLRDGLRLTVAADVQIDTPIALLITGGSGPQVRVNQVRVIVELGARSHIRLIECYPDADAPNGFTNTVVQLALAEEARADYLRLQDCHAQHMQIGRLIARLQRGAALHHMSLDFGGGLVRNDIEAELAGTAAQVSLHGLYLATGRQHIDNHTRVDHRVGPSTSREEYRGIVSGRARCVFNGKAVVHAGADGTDAQQANHNLLLSERAEVDTKPELEIYADDVKCSHGATVGQLDPAALFYLRSRGLNAAQAARMLTSAFAARVLRELPVEAARTAVETILQERLATITAADGA